MALKILITGPESSGKSTLARALSLYYKGAFVPEYVRHYLDTNGPAYTEEDLLKIMRGQLKSEDETIASGATLLICDTGPEVIQVWSQEKYGRVDPEISAAVTAMDYDQILLCFPEFPWEPDPLREHPDPEDRRRLYEAYLKVLADKPFAALDPATRLTGEDQFKQAVRILSPLRL